MKVQATKTMTNALNKELKGTRFDGLMRFEWVTMGSDIYTRLVSSNFDDIDNDYNWNTGKCRAIKVVYPDGYYAMDNYITTRDLLSLFHSGSTLYDPGDTVETFAMKVFERYEI